MTALPFKVSMIMILPSAVPGMILLPGSVSGMIALPSMPFIVTITFVPANAIIGTALTLNAVALATVVT